MIGEELRSSGVAKNEPFDRQIASNHKFYRRETGKSGAITAQQSFQDPTQKSVFIGEICG